MLSQIVGISAFGIAIIAFVGYNGSDILCKIQDRLTSTHTPIYPERREFPVWSIEEKGSPPEDIPPGTRVVFPNGHYIITRPAGIRTNGYGRMTNKPRTPVPGYTYTI